MTTLTYRSLQPSSGAPYRRPVAQQPKNFRIASVVVFPGEHVGSVRISPTEAVPARFRAQALLEVPPLLVELEVFVEPGGFPRVDELTIRATNKARLTGATLRQVLLDQLLRAAIAEASIPAIDRSDVAPGAFQTSADDEQTAWIGMPPGASERVRLVAEIYNRNVAAGSRAPTQAVADTIHISRPQASRYVKRARELNLLPPVGVSPDEWAAPMSNAPVWRVRHAPQDELDEEPEGVGPSFVTADERDERRRRFHEGMARGLAEQDQADDEEGGEQ